MNAPATIVVVDDDVTNIAIVAQLLEPEFEVAFATSGTQALELIGRVMPDLVLLDVMMPDMDGYTLCTRLKEDPVTAAIPIIFITGLQESDSERQGLQLGAADYVTKPFSPSVLRARVRNHVELKQTRDRLMSLATSDGLTGLANRRAFDAALEGECKRLARTHAPIALVMLDIDHFKSFNDRYGHVAGDDCLRRVADVLAAVIRRPADLAARYGGEEFICILPDTQINGAVTIAERIQAGIATLSIPIADSKTAAIVSASFGVVSEICNLEMDHIAILRSADSCLYKAKNAGRNRIVSAG